MLLEQLAVNDFDLCSNPQNFGTGYLFNSEGVETVPENPNVYWLASKDWAMGLFPVFNPRKNGAKTLIVLLCLSNVILCSFSFSSPARTGILLLRLRINRNFDQRIVENIRDDFLYFQPV